MPSISIQGVVVHVGFVPRGDGLGQEVVYEQGHGSDFHIVDTQTSINNVPTHKDLLRF